MESFGNGICGDLGADADDGNHSSGPIAEDDVRRPFSGGSPADDCPDDEGLGEDPREVSLYLAVGPAQEWRHFFF